MGQKRDHRLMTIILSVLNRFKIFFIRRYLGKFAVKRVPKIPPHLAYVATLPCETLMSTKKLLNNIIQGSVATYLRCGGVVNNRIKKSLLLSLWVEIFNRWIFRAESAIYDCLVILVLWQAFCRRLNTSTRLFVRCTQCTGWAKKTGPQTHEHNSVKS